MNNSYKFLAIVSAYDNALGFKANYLISGRSVVPKNIEGTKMIKECILKDLAKAKEDLLLPDYILRYYSHQFMSTKVVSIRSAGYTNEELGLKEVE